MHSTAISALEDSTREDAMADFVVSFRLGKRWLTRKYYGVKDLDEAKRRLRKDHASAEKASWYVQGIHAKRGVCLNLRMM